MVIVVYSLSKKMWWGRDKNFPPFVSFMIQSLKGQWQDLGHRLGFLLVWGLVLHMPVPLNAGIRTPYLVLFLYLIP